jgi:hypothetical protein
MGLDWCVRARTIDGKDLELANAENMLSELRTLENEKYFKWLKVNGHERPFSFPNKITEAWRKTEGSLEISEKITAWEQVCSTCVISPLETIKAPVVGKDAAATTWALENYRDAIKIMDGARLSSFLELYPTEESYMEYSEGMRVPELAELKDGLGTCTGIFSGAESFRGKMLRYIDWLDDDLQNNAYEDQDPEELEAYGKELLEAVKEAPEDATEADINILKDAANWCVFWGEHGHGMHAWY